MRIIIYCKNCRKLIVCYEPFFKNILLLGAMSFMLIPCSWKTIRHSKKQTNKPPPQQQRAKNNNNNNNIPGTGLSGFRIFCQRNLDSGFQLLAGFPIPRAVFRIPKARIADSTNKIFKDFGIWIPTQVSKDVTYMYVSFSYASLLAARETSICRLSG